MIAQRCTAHDSWTHGARDAPQCNSELASQQQRAALKKNKTLVPKCYRMHAAKHCRGAGSNPAGTAQCIRMNTHSILYPHSTLAFYPGFLTQLTYSWHSYGDNGTTSERSLSSCAIGKASLKQWFSATKLYLYSMNSISTYSTLFYLYSTLQLHYIVRILLLLYSTKLEYVLPKTLTRAEYKLN